MNRFLCEISAVLRNFETILFGRYPFPPGSLGLIVHSPSETTTTPQPFSIKDFIGDGFLWAVPKHRRSIEVRMKRKYGSPQYKMKTLYENKKLQICDTCGNYYESGILCGFCYDKVRKETTLIKEKIMKKLHLKPIDSDVVVLYEGEKGEHADEFWEGKRIVEMEKPRPQWFSKNLLQKTTQPNATTKEVKPEELG